VLRNFKLNLLWYTGKKMTIEIKALPIEKRKTCPKEFSFGVTFA